MNFDFQYFVTFFIEDILYGNKKKSIFNIIVENEGNIVNYAYIT